jgi:hypothetical protein
LRGLHGRRITGRGEGRGVERHGKAGAEGLRDWGLGTRW